MSKEVLSYTAAPYGRRVKLYLTEKALNRALARLKWERAPGALGLCYNTPKAILLRVRDKSKYTLLHECTHAALMILEHVGIDPTAAGGEPMAYLLEHMYAHFAPAI